MTNDDLYRAVRARMSSLLRDAEGGLPVPACPAWTVRQLLAHVVGGAADVVAGRLEGVATDPWTEAQVQARADRTIEDLLTEWDDVAPRLLDALEPFGGVPGQLVFDVVTHEHDLRHALGASGGRDAASIDAALGWVGRAWASAAPHGPATLRLDTGDHHFDLGDGEPIAVVTLTAFDALRALAGRRSAAQLVAYDATAPIDPWLGAFTWGPFALRAEPLDET